MKVVITKVEFGFISVGTLSGKDVIRDSMTVHYIVMMEKGNELIGKKEMRALNGVMHLKELEDGIAEDLQLSIKKDKDITDDRDAG